MDGSQESPISGERLKQMVIAGAVENRKRLGYDRGRDPFNNPLWKLHGKVCDEPKLKRAGRSGLFIGRDDFERGKSTRVLFAPIKALRVTESLPWDKNNIAVCFVFWANKMDSYKRSGQLSGIAIMLEESARQFSLELKRDPRILFALARTINNGPIRQWDGEPADIKAGEAVTILPNKQLGGDIEKHVVTNPFPTDYNPNQLY